MSVVSGFKPSRPDDPLKPKMLKLPTAGRSATGKASSVATKISRPAGAELPETSVRLNSEVEDPLLPKYAPRHWITPAMRLHPGVLHRDSLAKYAAAFFRISLSSLASANARRSRLSSASSSPAERFTGAPPAGQPLSLPCRCRRIQFHILESGMPSRLAAWLPGCRQPTQPVALPPP